MVILKMSDVCYMFLIAIIFQMSHLTIGFNLNDVGSIKCDLPPNPVDVGLDMNWLTSLRTFYIPLMSKSDYYYQLSYLLEKELDELEDYDWKAPNTCQEVGFKSLLFKGAGKEVLTTVNSKPEEDGGMHFKANWANSTPGKVYFNLTDNKNYVLTLQCMDDAKNGKILTWSVFSPHRKLQKEIEKEILKHVKSIGFPIEEQFIVREEYTNCPDLGGDKIEL